MCEEDDIITSKCRFHTAGPGDIGSALGQQPALLVQR